MTPSSGRLIAIGDIHGHLNALNSLLDKLSLTAHDQLIFLGDYIDRGPNSHGVLARLIDIRNRFPKTVFLRGNHEQWLLNWLFRDDDTFLYLGGRQTKESYVRALKSKLDPDELRPRDFLDLVPKDHLRFLTESRLFYECEDCIFVHGGLNPSITSLHRQRAHDLLLGHRDFFSAKNYQKMVVVGHTSTQIFRSLKPVFRKNGIIMADTSCERTGLLSAVLPHSQEFVQAQVTP